MQTQFDEIIICVIQQNAVQFQKDNHRQNTDPLIPIDESMVSNQRMAEPRGLLFR